MDSAKLRRLLIERSGGITLSICRAIERAGATAIRNGRERIDLSGLDDATVWRGISRTRTESDGCGLRRLPAFGRSRRRASIAACATLAA